jgi:hypothetical protein
MTEVQRLRQLEGENAQLERPVADLTLDKHILMETIRRPVTPTPRRARALWIRETSQIDMCPCPSARGLLAIGVVQEKHPQEYQSALRMRTREPPVARPRFGYICMHMLLRREGRRVNKERVRQLYRLQELLAALCE